jgi:hypothetical protein
MSLSDQTNIRGIDPLLWREIRAESVRHGTPAGELLNTILQEWLQAHDCATGQGPQADIQRRN